MSKKKFLQVFEYQKLKYDENQDFKKHHFDAMVLFNEKNQNKYFTIVHKGVLFNSYVGVLQIGGLTIEILLKADNSNNSYKGICQKVLL
jgi:5-methylcytosine-specific restriction enzyme subunit McrC